MDFQGQKLDKWKLGVKVNYSTNEQILMIG